MSEQAIPATVDMSLADEKRPRNYLTLAALGACGLVEIGWIALIGWGGLRMIGY